MSAQVRLWWVEADASAAALTQFDDEHQLLTRTERETLSGPRKLVRTALRAALWHSASEHIARAAFEQQPSGRPVLKGAGQARIFSVSHTSHHAILALAEDGPLGVDLEADRSITISAARREQLANQAGVAGLDSPDPAVVGRDDRAFLQLWVRLEAVAKARGTGIGALLTDLARPGTASVPANPSPIADWFTNCNATVTMLALPGQHVGALVHHSALPVGRLRVLPTTVDGLEHLCQRSSAR